MQDERDVADEEPALAVGRANWVRIDGRAVGRAQRRARRRAGARGKRAREKAEATHFSPSLSLSSPSRFSFSPFSAPSMPFALSSFLRRRLSWAPDQGANVEPTSGANDTPEPPAPRTERPLRARARGGRWGASERAARSFCSACQCEGERVRGGQCRTRRVVGARTHRREARPITHLELRGEERLGLVLACRARRRRPVVVVGRARRRRPCIVVVARGCCGRRRRPRATGRSGRAGAARGRSGIAIVVIVAVGGAGGRGRGRRSTSVGGWAVRG